MTTRKKSRSKLIEECEVELRRIQQECLDIIHDSKKSLATSISGDEGDMSQALEERSQSYAKQQMLEKRLTEVSAALERIQEGTYGICEETGEDIEEKRLLALPWTKYSLEGAEIRERTQKRYASVGGDSDAKSEFSWTEGATED
ncbi:MAG: TraR/DksA C4-type zinc finger protein [bacterium]|nr:TraR/DksA C4-type zinc finger protein [bacterium]